MTSSTDRLNGGAGADTASYAGAASTNTNDRLWGGSGADRLERETGGDDLIGGLGRDVLVGGSGYDAFILTSVADSANGSLRDFISDFVEDVDRIDFSRIDARPDVAGNQDFWFRRLSRFHRTGSDQLSHSGGNITLVDADSIRVEGCKAVFCKSLSFERI